MKYSEDKPRVDGTFIPNAWYDGDEFSDNVAIIKLRDTDTKIKFIISGIYSSYKIYIDGNNVDSFAARNITKEYNLAKNKEVKISQVCQTGSGIKATLAFVIW